MKLKIIADTWFKKDSIAQSATLERDRKLAVLGGMEFEILAFREVNPEHWIITFAESLPTLDGSKKFNTWTVFKGHAELIAPKPTFRTIVTKTLTPMDIDRVASRLGVERAAVQAVLAVESSGSGILPNGRCKILFEAHHFSRFTKRKFDSTYPDISSRTWNRSLYKGGTREWDRLERAIALDREAALKSASWGLGQVMGFNYSAAGFGNVFDFVEAMDRGEGEQLDAMFNFIRANPAMLRSLRNKDWAGFALRYNGAGFRANRYNEKLAAAYKRAKG